MTTRPCPICSEPVEQRTNGRPAVYCSPSHRRLIEHLRRDLARPESEAVTAERSARNAAKYGWASAHTRRYEADRLDAELIEARHMVARADAITG